MLGLPLFPSPSLSRICTTTTTNTKLLLSIYLSISSLFDVTFAQLESVEPAQRWGAASTILQNPPTLVVYGGQTSGSGGQTISSAPESSDLLMLDLSTSFETNSTPWRQWSSSDSNAPPVSYHTLSVLSSQTLLIFGGSSDAVPLPNANDSTYLAHLPPLDDEEEEEDQNQNPTFQHVLSTLEPSRRRYHSLSSASTETTTKAWLYGGISIDGSANAYDELWEYSATINSNNGTASQGTWTFIPKSSNSPPPLYGHTSTLITGSDSVLRMFIIGGVSSASTLNQMSQVYVFTPDLSSTGGGSWSTIQVTGADSFRARMLHIATPLSNSRIFVHGGTDAGLSTAYDDMSILTISEDASTISLELIQDYNGQTFEARHSHFAATINDVVFMGFGYGTAAPCPATIGVFDSNSNSFSTSYDFSSTASGPSTNGGNSGGGSRSSSNNDGDDFVPNDGMTVATDAEGNPDSGSGNGNGSTSNGNDNDDNGGSSSPSTKQTAGIIVGALGALALCVASGLLYCRRRRRQGLPVMPIANNHNGSNSNNNNNLSRRLSKKIFTAAVPGRYNDDSQSSTFKRMMAARLTNRSQRFDLLSDEASEVWNSRNISHERYDSQSSIDYDPEKQQLYDDNNNDYNNEKPVPPPAAFKTSSNLNNNNNINHFKGDSIDDNEIHARDIDYLNEYKGYQRPYQNPAESDRAGIGIWNGLYGTGKNNNNNNGNTNINRSNSNATSSIFERPRSYLGNALGALWVTNSPKTDSSSIKDEEPLTRGGGGFTNTRSSEDDDDDYSDEKHANDFAVKSQQHQQRHPFDRLQQHDTGKSNQLSIMSSNTGTSGTVNFEPGVISVAQRAQRGTPCTISPSPLSTAPSSAPDAHPHPHPHPQPHPQPPTYIRGNSNSMSDDDGYNSQHNHGNMSSASSATGITLTPAIITNVGPQSSSPNVMISSTSVPPQQHQRSNSGGFNNPLNRSKTWWDRWKDRSTVVTSPRANEPIRDPKPAPSLDAIAEPDPFGDSLAAMAAASFESSQSSSEEFGELGGYHDHHRRQSYNYNSNNKEDPMKITQQEGLLSSTYSTVDNSTKLKHSKTLSSIRSKGTETSSMLEERVRDMVVVARSVSGTIRSGKTNQDEDPFTDDASIVDSSVSDGSLKSRSGGGHHSISSHSHKSRHNNINNNSNMNHNNKKKRDDLVSKLGVDLGINLDGLVSSTSPTEEDYNYNYGATSGQDDYGYDDDNVILKGSRFGGNSSSSLQRSKSMTYAHLGKSKRIPEKDEEEQIETVQEEDRQQQQQQQQQQPSRSTSVKIRNSISSVAAQPPNSRPVTISSETDTPLLRSRSTFIAPGTPEKAIKYENNNNNNTSPRLPPPPIDKRLTAGSTGVKKLVDQFEQTSSGENSPPSPQPHSQLQSHQSPPPPRPPSKQQQYHRNLSAPASKTMSLSSSSGRKNSRSSNIKSSKSLAPRPTLYVANPDDQ